MAGKFVITKDKVGESRFALKAANGETIAVSEGYTEKARCQDGITAVIRNAQDAAVVDDTGE